MSATVSQTVTDLEYQILQILQHHATGAVRCKLNWIMVRGTGGMLFGSGWVDRTYTDGVEGRSLISLALGRLYRKGLVERFDSSNAQAHDRSWGFWKLSPSGCQLMGIA